MTHHDELIHIATMIGARIVKDQEGRIGYIVAPGGTKFGGESCFCLMSFADRYRAIANAKSELANRVAELQTSQLKCIVEDLAGDLSDDASTVFFAVFSELCERIGGEAAEAIYDAAA